MRHFILVLILIIPISLISPQAHADDNELFLVAQKAFEDGFYDVALRYIDQLFEEYPQTEKRVQANLILGQCYFFKSQYLKAYEIFQDNLQYSEFKDATLFWLGETYLKGSDYTQAEDHFNQLFELFPKSVYRPQALYSLGWMYYEKEDYDQAQNIFLKMIQQFPTHQLSEDSQFKLGETTFTLQNFEETIKHLKKYILNYPNSNRHPEAYFYLAESYYYLEDFLNAISYYAKAAEISYDHNLIMMSKVSLGWSYLKLEKFSLAEEKFQEALKYSQEKGILSDDVYLGLANLYTKINDNNKAKDAYMKIIEMFSNSQRIAESYLGIANIHYQTGEYAEAVLNYQTVIDKFGNAPEYSDTVEKSFFGLAWSYLKSGNIDEAVKIFNNIKDSASNDTVKISALTQIGDAYQDIEEFDKALGIYDEILTNYPESIYTDYVQYRQAVALLKMGEIEAATMSFQSLAINFPNSKYNKDKDYYLAVAYFKQEDWITARHQILNFIENITPISSPYMAEAQNILALCYYNLNQFEKAMITFQNIIKNHPEHINLVQDAQLNIAKSYYNLGQHNEAVKRFRIVVNKYPKSHLAEEALIWLGDHYLKTSDYDNAIVYYQQFLDDFPGSEKINLIRFELAQSFEGKKNYEAAIKAYNTIDQEQDKEIFTKARIAIADIFSRTLDPASALDTYEKIIASSPEFKRDAFLKIAQVHTSTKKYEDALKAYSEALQSEQGLSQIKNAQLHFQIADTYELLNKNEKAVEEYFKVPYLYPNDKAWSTKSYLRIARIFEDEERWEEAKKIYDKVLELKQEESKFATERIEWIQENIQGGIL